MPKDLNSSAQMCCSALSNHNIRPVIIIVDAVNQVCLYYIMLSR